ncbi:hypothetical protein C3L33_13074, partial [Rhododendron williamsianum]
MELDDWELSTDELDSLERDALKQIAQRNSSSSASSSAAAAAATSTSSLIPSHSRQQLQQQQQHHSAHFNPQCQYSHSVPIAESCPKNKVDASPSASRILTASTEPKATSELLLIVYAAFHCLFFSYSSSSSYLTLSFFSSQPVLSVKFFLHATGNIAAKFLYDQVLVGAFRKISKASWNAKERSALLWMLPISSLSSAEKVLTELSGFKVEVESLDPLVRHAIVAASAVPDLRDRYDMIPGNVESKLLPFQRDGVRFAAIKILIAFFFSGFKSMEHAIAVTTCIRDAWPVLVLTPSSLRLHWASTLICLILIDHKVKSEDLIPVLDEFSELKGLKMELELSIKNAWSARQEAICPIPLLAIIAQVSSVLKQKELSIDYGHRAACPGVVCGGDTEQDRVAGSEEGVLLRAVKYLTTAAEGMGVVEAVEGGSEETVAAAVRLGEELVVIADESHFLKNGQAKRTSASLPILQKAQYAILLSGTPALSRPIELFKQLEALYPNVYKNVHEFGNRYCKGGIFGVYQGASNHEELHNLMKATLMIRRLKRDVLSELPVKRRQQNNEGLQSREQSSKRVSDHGKRIFELQTRVSICVLGFWNSKLDYQVTFLDIQISKWSFEHGFRGFDGRRGIGGMFRAWVQGGGSVITGSPSVMVAMGFEVDIMEGGSAMVFLDLAEKDMRQINALFRELEVVKSKIRASQSKEEAESLKFSEKHLINKQNRGLKGAGIGRVLSESNRNSRTRTDESIRKQQNKHNRGCQRLASIAQWILSATEGHRSCKSVRRRLQRSGESPAGSDEVGKHAWAFNILSSVV